MDGKKLMDAFQKDFDSDDTFEVTDAGGNSTTLSYSEMKDALDAKLQADGAAAVEAQGQLVTFDLSQARNASIFSQLHIKLTLRFFY